MKVHTVFDNSVEGKKSKTWDKSSQITYFTAYNTDLQW